MFVPDHPPAAEIEKLSGIVQRITFHSVETGYTVLKVSSFQKPQEALTVVVISLKCLQGYPGLLRRVDPSSPVRLAV